MGIITKSEFTCSFINAEHGDVICALIAAEKKLSGWINGETAWVVATSPLFGDKTERSVTTDSKDAYAIMEAVPDIKELSIGGDDDFRAEISPFVANW